MPPTKPAAPVSSTCLEVGEPVRLAIVYGVGPPAVGEGLAGGASR